MTAQVRTDHDGDAAPVVGGTRLTTFALDRMRDVAMVETGGDPGHAPARRSYEKAGFTLLPIGRYFKAL